MTLSANFSSIDTAEAALRRIRAACPGIHKIRILASPTHRIAGSGMDRQLPGVFSIVPTRTTAMGNEFVTQVMSETLPSRHDPEPFLRESVTLQLSCLPGSAPQISGLLVAMGGSLVRTLS